MRLSQNLHLCTSRWQRNPHKVKRRKEKSQFLLRCLVCKSVRGPILASSHFLHSTKQQGTAGPKKDAFALSHIFSIEKKKNVLNESKTPRTLFCTARWPDLKVVEGTLQKKLSFLLIFFPWHCFHILSEQKSEKTSDCFYPVFRTWELREKGTLPKKW